MQLDRVSAAITANENQFKQPGVFSVRPGYLTQNDWPTNQPAIVVIVSGDPSAITLPETVAGFPVEKRTATPAETLRYTDPALYQRLAARSTPLATGAFPEVQPNVNDDYALEDRALADEGAGLLANQPKLDYSGPNGVTLEPVKGKLKILCHASPDAGFPTLQKFLSSVEKTLSVSMYDFTSGHILDAVEGAMTGTKTMEITLDNPARNSTADQSDSDSLSALSTQMGDSFTSAWALVRSSNPNVTWIYPNAYHIKVAVSDSKVLWLSSGNWNNSNQPNMDPIGAPAATDQAIARKSDRDWHIVAYDEKLAKNFEAYLAHDFEVANDVEKGGTAALQDAAAADVMPAELLATSPAAWVFFPPKLIDEEMTITPLLTPDPGVYTGAMLDMLNAAETSVYIQLQYIHPPNTDKDAEFGALIDAVITKITAGLDVRIICSQWQKTNGWLERLQSAGILLTNVKLQNGVHNKGFIVDSKVVALGSQNWSSDGVLRNRDASVIIANETAAKYYEQIFLHDWNNRAKQSIAG